MPRRGRGHKFVGPRLDGGASREVAPKAKPCCARCGREWRNLRFLEIEGESIGPLCGACHRIFPQWLERALRAARRNYSKYGITVADYWQLYRAQMGMCAICQNRRRGMRGLVIDHDHETGRVRALLCAKCNSAIGLLADDPEIIRSAADYLTLHHAERPERHIA